MYVPMYVSILIPQPTSQSLLNVNAIHRCQCYTSMSETFCQDSKNIKKQYLEKQKQKKHYF